jgi:hypothetical protein
MVTFISSPAIVPPRVYVASLKVTAKEILSASTLPWRLLVSS